MARRITDKTLDSRSGRKGLKARSKPYYRSIGAGLHLGYRRGKTTGVWVIRRYVSAGKYEVSTFADADDTIESNGETVLTFFEAQNRARDLHRKAEVGEPVGPFTVREAVNEYIGWLEGHRKSARDARYRADALILPELGDVEISKLTASKLRDWLMKISTTPARLRTKPGKDQQFRDLPKDDPDALRKRRATANRTLTVLKGALNFAFREGKVSSDTAWRRVQPFKSADAAKIRFLSVAEAQRLVNACHDLTFRNLVKAALETGCRYGELAALQVNDFNPDSGTLHIRDSKSGRGRHVVLTDGGVKFFRSLIAGRQGTETLFLKEDKTAWGYNHQLRPMREACERAKLEDVSFHILRHCWAALSVQNGMPLQIVAKNLGHSDSRMTERHYAHLSPSVEADMIRRAAPTFDFGADSNVVGIDR